MVASYTATCPHCQHCAAVEWEHVKGEWVIVALNACDHLVEATFSAFWFAKLERVA